MSDSLISVIDRELEGLLEPITLAVDDVTWRARFLSTIGINTDVDVALLVSALSTVLDLKRQLMSLASSEAPSFEEIASVLNAADKVCNRLRNIESVGLGPAFEGLAGDLLQSLITSQLSNAHPLFFALLRLLTVIEPSETAPPIAAVVYGDEILRLPMPLDRIHPKRVIDLLHDPIRTLQTYYTSDLVTIDDANRMSDKLFPRIADLLTELSVANRYGLPERNISVYGDGGPLLDHALTVFLAERVSGAPADIGFTLALSASDRGDLGLVVIPFGALTQTFEAGKWKFAIAFTSDVEGLAYGKNGFVLAADTSISKVEGALSATLAVPRSGPAFVLGSLNGTRLEIGGAEIKALTSLSEARQSLTLSADVSKSAIVIAPGDGDGVLSRVLPADGVRADFDLGLTWSNEHGLSFRGAAGLDADLPVGLTLGGLSIPSIHLALIASDSNIATEVSANVSASIGAFFATINRVGLAALITFPENGGNLGVADLDFHFKSPSGIGIVVDAEVVKGGGFLAITPTGDYFGALELTIKETVSVKAIGVIGTKTPDGSRGFSFAAIITVTDFPGINLGFGFRLTGVGGIIGIDRTFDFEKLEQKLKQGLLRSLLFPPNPVANATAILADFTQVFPAARDHHVFGLMFRIVWGTENLVTIDLAAIITDTIAILGVVDVCFPRIDLPQVELHVHVIGLLDLGGKRIFVHAEILNTSRIFGFKVSGGAAMLVTWGDNPIFILSFGGFNRRYEPHLPSGFPALDRLTVQLIDRKNLTATLHAYFAVTSNSLQIGGSLDMKAGTGKFKIEGSLTLDALIQFHGNPKFVFDLDASLVLKAWDLTVFSVHVSGTLSGGRPWHARGSASFKIWRFHFSVDFDEVWGDPPDDEVLTEVDVRSLLIEAFQDIRNWTAELPPAAQGLVTLRESLDGSHVMLHPLSALTITQRVAPLNVSLSRFGNAKPQGQNLFTIENVSVGAFSFKRETVGEHFARSQFLDMTEDEKLESPAFEKMDCGVRLVTAPVQFDGDLPTSVLYKTLRYNPATKTLVPVDEAPDSTAAPPHLFATGAAASGPSAVSARQPAPVVKISPLEYVVTNVIDQSPVAEKRVATYTKAVELMEARIAAREHEKSELQVLEVIR